MLLKDGNEMVDQKDKKTIIVKQKSAPDITVDLAEFLEVLGSPVRLAILKLLESKPMDVENISHFLWKDYHKTSSRENTKNHVDKLLSIGVVMKQPGIRENRAVINYVMIPGSIETIMRTLGKVMKFNLNLELSSQVLGVQDKISEEFSSSFASIKVLGGEEDGKEFSLRGDEIKVGRVDPKNVAKYDPKNDIALSDKYEAVTRISKPHAKLILEDGKWFIAHCEGVNQTYLWNKKLEKDRKELLKDGDVIALAEGTKGVRLVFLQPKTKSKDN
jgi:hypothetical protein